MAEPEEFDLEELSEDEKDELIISLAGKLNHTFMVTATLFNTMSEFRLRLLAYDKFGKRGAILRDSAWRMGIVLDNTLSALDIDVDQLQADAEFERIIDEEYRDDDE